MTYTILGISCNYPPRSYMFKVNNRNIRTRVWNFLKVNNKDTNIRSAIKCSLTLFRMGLFGAAHIWGEKKGPPFLKLCRTYPTVMRLGTVIPYLKNIQKILKLCDTTLEFCWHQYFFTGNQHFSLYQEILTQILFWYLISNSFNFFRIFKDCFNKHGYNFVDVSRNC